MKNINCKKQLTLPLVLHGISNFQSDRLFDDVTVDVFNYIVENCNGLTRTELSELNDTKKMQFIITFDDGHLSAFLHGVPKLLENNCKAIFFITTDFIGKPGFMDKNQIKDLVDLGMEVGSHSVGHPDMRTLDHEAAKAEFLRSKYFLEELIGIEVTKFSFPFGKYKDEHLSLAKQCGYQSIFGSMHGLVSKEMDIYPRNSINASMTLNNVSGILRAAFKTRVSWFLEDQVKWGFKTLFGDVAYRSLRDKLFLAAESK